MTLSHLDAFTIPMVVNEIGVPFAGLDVIARARSRAPEHEELAARLGSQEATLRPIAESSAESIGLVAHWLKRSGLTPPPAPRDMRSYMAWHGTIIDAVRKAEASGSAEEALTFLGACVGGVLQAAMLLAGIIDLRLAHDVLEDDDRNWTRAFASWAERLESASRLAALPEAARRYATAMAETAAQALAARQQLGGRDMLRVYRAVNDRLQSIVPHLRGALPGED